ncbi:endonuclease, partial [Escherichia coli]|nr:endonuclease [Escherichia coli]
TGKTFHARRPVARLDRIMASPELTITDAGVHDSLQARTASDHLPIWATLQKA